MVAFLPPYPPFDVTEAFSNILKEAMPGVTINLMFRRVAEGGWLLIGSVDGHAVSSRVITATELARLLGYMPLASNYLL